MALLTISGRRLPWFALLLGVLALGAAPVARAQAGGGYAVKAAFLFNFAQFVAWPPEVFTAADAPMVIGVLGVDPFGKALDDLVRGEMIGTHPLVVRRFRRVDEIDACHILFVSASESTRLESVVARLNNRSILTVGDFEGFAARGGMIRFAVEKNKIRLHINLTAAQANGLMISSKLLRSSEVLASGQD